MKRLVKTIFAGLVGLGLAIAPAGAADTTPVGKWKLDAGESHYDVQFCGDGKQLCATVIYLGGSDLNEKTKPYLNTLLLDRADPVGTNKWRGTVSLFGDSLGGTVEILGPDVMKLTGCKFIFCKSFKLLRL